MTAFDPPGPRGPSERVYALLMQLYPAAFREHYRDEMVRLFADQLRDARVARASGGVVTIWLRTLADLISSAIREHLRKDRTVAQSLASFEPTVPMRLLGLFGSVGAILLLWGYVSYDPVLNNIRLPLFSLGGAAISVAFYRRQALAAPTLALLTTAAVVITGISYATWLFLDPGFESLSDQTVDVVHAFVTFSLSLAPALWAIGLLYTGAAWQGMPRELAFVTRFGVVSLAGSILAWIGDDPFGLFDSRSDDLLVWLTLAGVLLNGIGWVTLGAALVIGRSSAKPA